MFAQEFTLAANRGALGFLGAHHRNRGLEPLSTHYEIDPIASQRLFDTAGLDAVGRISTDVYRARDAAGAQLIGDYMAQQFNNGKDQPAPAVPGMPNAKCIDRRHNDIAMGAKQPDFVCIASADRYAYMTHSQQLDDAHQRTAAQYLMLVAK